MPNYYAASFWADDGTLRGAVILEHERQHLLWEEAALAIKALGLFPKDSRAKITLILDDVPKDVAEKYCNRLLTREETAAFNALGPLGS